MKLEPLRGKLNIETSRYGQTADNKKIIDDVKSASDFYLRYCGIEGRQKLREEQPDVFEARIKYHSTWIHKGTFWDYNEWLFRYTFSDTIEEIE